MPRRRSTLTIPLLILSLGAMAMAAPAAEAAADESGAHWNAERIDVDVLPDFKARKVRVRGRLVLRLEAEESAGPTIRIGHDMEPLNDHPEFMRFTRIDAGPDSRGVLNRAGDKRGIVLADVRFATPRRKGQRVTIAFEAESLNNSFEFVITDKVAVGADSTGWYPRPVPAAGEIFKGQVDPTPGVTRVHMPEGWRSLATGAFVSQAGEAGDRVETWRQDTRRARSFVVGPYKVAHRKLGTMDVGVYSLTPAVDPDTFLTLLESTMTPLTRRFGPYPFSKYAAAEFPNEAVRWWGDALGDFHVLRTSLVEICRAFCLGHEIGHAWWGNRVAPKWPGGFMMSEALAEYSGFLVLEDLQGRGAYEEAIALRKVVTGMPPDYTLENHFKFVAQGKDVPLSQSLESDGIHYQLAIVKGSRVYHMLRRRVGDEVFFATLRGLIARHGGDKVSLNDLRRAFIVAAPDKDLPRFFEQWLDRTGAPAFRTAIACAPGPGGRTVNRLTLEQTQAGAPYAFEIEAALQGRAARSQTVRIEAKTTVTEIVADECFTGVELDPRRDLFLWRPAFAAPVEAAG